MGVAMGDHEGRVTAPDRRRLLGGIAAAATMPAMLRAAPVTMTGERLFVGTALRSNRLALSFERFEQPLPKITLTNGAHQVSLDTLVGKARIVTLWAEWCVPCLVEARDFAALQRRFAGPTFEIVAVLTASAQKLDFAAARARLTQARVDGLPLLVEPDGGRRLMLGLSPSPSGQGGSLPCTLLVDSRGRIRGRSRGMLTAMRASQASAMVRSGTPLSEAGKQAMLASDLGTLWNSPSGEALVSALRDGILDKL
ncbi:TlpA disulfide reductase family protein [Sphingomonas sp. AR_OL41]|uniref:TlpA family protein disulfide reductase n=1 Tax=Sphingomonas sp. AR_OL41 TaxID=3042729 RepID=UPI0024802A6F|nr:TlpA disulfide reductase family protein [Sphingomonas sp. AR_OL41]MDH7973934.1 TlpA disulfide reductase family protein [Sphingomonas sp. AR_OL41]